MRSGVCLFLLATAVSLAAGQQFFLSEFIQPPAIQQAITYDQPPTGPGNAVGQQFNNFPPSASSNAIGTGGGGDLANPTVVLHSAIEAQLPPQLLNPFYKNPRIAEALAKESWFGPGEMHVTGTRETEKIPRTRIFSVLKNAGLARRRR